MTWMTKQLGHSERLADLTHHGFVCETDKCLGTRHRFDTSVIVGHVCVSSRTNEPCGYGLVHSKSNHRNVIHEACKSWKPGVCMVSIMKHKPEDFRWVCTYPDIRQDCTGCASAVIWNRLIQVSLYDTFSGNQWWHCTVICFLSYWAIILKTPFVGQFTVCTGPPWQSKRPALHLCPSVAFDCHVGPMIQ